jgi:hypothetical protein
MYRGAALVLIASCGFSPGQSSGRADGSASPDARVTIDAAIDAGLEVPQMVQAMDPGYTATQGMIAIQINATAGNLLVAATYTADLTGALTVTDTAGLTWKSAAAISAPGCAPSLQMWYAPVLATASNTVTVTQTGSSALGMELVEYSGIDTATPVDTSGGAVAPAAASVVDSGLIVTNAPDVLVALFADLNGTGAMTAGSGLTQRGIDSNFYTLLGDDVPGITASSLHLTATLPNGKNDACWTASVLALRIGHR